MDGTPAAGLQGFVWDMGFARDNDEVVVNHTYGADGHIRLAKRMVSM
jgi:hypothetical protein